MTNDKTKQSQTSSRTIAIIVRILFFLIPFGFIGIISLVSGKSYTNSMADYALYKRYFAAAIFILFLIIAILLAAKEYNDYRENKDPHTLALVKISIMSAIIFGVLLSITLLYIHFLKRQSVQTRARIEGFNRTANGISTAFDIFRMK